MAPTTQPSKCFSQVFCTQTCESLSAPAWASGKRRANKQTKEIVLNGAFMSDNREIHNEIDPEIRVVIDIYHTMMDDLN